MKVFNLTDGDVVYRNRLIPPQGGFVDFPDLTFIPDRDRALQKSGMLAFGSLPASWLEAREKKTIKTHVPVKPLDEPRVVPPKVDDPLEPQKKFELEDRHDRKRK